MAPVGFHFMLELGGVEPHKLDDVAFITESLRDAATRSALTVLGEVQHKFEPQGVTAMALLAESHLTIHTWPEHGYAAVDLFTCGQRAAAEQACNELAAAFDAREVKLHLMHRGLTASEPLRVLRPRKASVRG